MTDEVMAQETTVDMSETSSYDDLFSDDTEETEEETTETETEAEAAPPETESEEESGEETTEPEESLDLKYLGQTTKLPKASVDKVAAALGKNPDEVIALLQMGMNYNNTPEKKLLARFAEANGITYEEYIKGLEKSAESAEEAFASQRIKEEHPDWDDEKVSMQARLDLIDKRNSKAEKERAAQFELDKPILEFMQKYPDVKEFPDSVKADINRGVHPIVAYESYVQNQNYEAKLAELNTKLAQAQKEQENKKKSTGSLKDTDDGGERDMFLEGLGKY